MIKRTTSNQNFGGNLSQGLFRHVFFFDSSTLSDKNSEEDTGEARSAEGGIVIRAM